MNTNLSTFSIASNSYSTTITDRGLFTSIKGKEYLKNDKTKNEPPEEKDTNSANVTKQRRRISKRTSASSLETSKIWFKDKEFDDTSNSYRKPYINLRLWTRIFSNSSGSLPIEIARIGSEEISNQDRLSVESYTTSSRGCRKCGYTLFAACSKYAARSIGFFKDSSQCTYNCKPISLSVEDLSKNTHSGTDLLGKKNDPIVQQRVINQLNDLFRRPTSHKVIGKNPSILFDLSKLKNMYGLPELIFHRFQASYDAVSKTCKEKVRVVWCVPYLIVSLEAIFFSQIIEKVKIKMLTSNEAIYPIGMTNYQIGQKSVRTLREKFEIIGSKNCKIYSLDFKKFDINIPIWSKDIFFASVKPLINLDVNQSKVFDFLRVYVKYTPFVYKDKVLYKKRGISSGLLITNLFDTWWNLCIHYVVKIIQIFFYDSIDEILYSGKHFDKLTFDTSKLKYDSLISEPLVRVMGDDSLLLCDEETLALHKRVCELLGMEVTIKHVTNDPKDDIFFLGRYWNKDNRPFQTEEYMALRIVYSKWYDKKVIPFDLEFLHLYRMLSICLPLVGGKDFLDKYLFDYPPYKKFCESDEGFVYMKDFIENTFRYYSIEELSDVDNY